jgi:asparagine synthase (glutamine-hydrolysing)
MSMLSADSPKERQRASGRVCGVVGSADFHVRQRLARGLGASGQVLGDEPDAFVVDHDACWLMSSASCEPLAWRSLCDRLQDVGGAFAIAWREEDGSVCLARDPIGERTLFYAVVNGSLVFASSVCAILATGLVPFDIDVPAVASYLSYAYVPGSATLVRGVREVQPGEIVHWRGGVTTARSFWSLPTERVGVDAADEMGFRDQLRSQLELAVQRRLPTREPVGAFLSGGIDSSLVVALAARMHDRPVHTYSVSFGREYPNELAFSSLVADHCRTRHHIVEVPARAIADNFDTAVALLDVPNGDPLTVPNLLLFREAARDVGVVLNGEGGDPCFGGPKNQPMLLATLLGDGQANAGDPYARERTYLRAHQKCYDELTSIFEPSAMECVGDAVEAELAPWFVDDRWHSFVTKLMAINVRFKGAHHILPKVDALSAPFGVVARSPLFDRSIVETAFLIPPQLKLRGSVEKYILKRAVDDLLPAAIVERPKSGMLVPVQGWFHGPLRNFARERLLDGLAGVGLFRRAYLEQLLHGRLPGLRPRRGVKIWLLLTLESWLRSLRS